MGNSPSFIKINFIKTDIPFKNDCMINYRLAILNDISECFYLNSLYLQNNIVKLYETPEQIVDYFKDDITQKKVTASNISYNFVLETISENNYILGMFDTFYCTSNEYYHKTHNFNAFLIYGIDNGEIAVYCNKGPSGSSCVTMSLQEINVAYVSNLDVVNDKKASSVFGLPLSVLRLKNNIKKTETEKINNCLSSFYLNDMELCNLNIIDHIIKNRFLMFLENRYPGYQYDVISNFKTMRDVFIFQNIVLKSNYDEIKNINLKIIHIFDIVVSLYSRFIYSDDHDYITRIIDYLVKIKNLADENKKRVGKNEKKNNTKIICVNNST